MEIVIGLTKNRFLAGNVVFRMMLKEERLGRCPASRGRSPSGLGYSPRYRLPRGPYGPWSGGNALWRTLRST